MGKIWKWHPPLFTLAVKMAFVDEAVESVDFAKVAFVVLTIMSICDLLVHLDEKRKNLSMFVSGINVDRWFSDKG